MLEYVASLSLLLAQVPATQPSPSPAPLKTIIRIRSTPFCTVFRENVFHAVQGLRINDLVIDQGRSVLAKWAYDSIADSGRFGGASRKMDQYQLGQVVNQAARNLERVHALLNDPDRFPTTPQNDADRDLLAVKATLQAVADSQERSLNILSGTYETAALDALLSLGNGAAEALKTGSTPEKSLDLGDPIFSSPSYIPPPSSSDAHGSLPSASSAHGSLFASTPVGKIQTAVVITQRMTGDAEDRVGAAVTPGVERCSDKS
jgi:hypothetical protein